MQKRVAYLQPAIQLLRLRLAIQQLELLPQLARQLLLLRILLAPQLLPLLPLATQVALLLLAVLLTHSQLATLVAMPVQPPARLIAIPVAFLPQLVEKALELTLLAPPAEELEELAMFAVEPDSAAPLNITIAESWDSVYWVATVAVQTLVAINAILTIQILAA